MIATARRGRVARSSSGAASRRGVQLAKSNAEGWMRYIVAWILGVPFSVIVLWYIVGHAACGH
jgi:hypothetical protein